MSLDLHCVMIAYIRIIPKFASYTIINKLLNYKYQKQNQTMKKLISIILLVTSTALSAQISEINTDNTAQKARAKVDSLAAELIKLKISDPELNFLNEALTALPPLVKDVLSLDHFDSVPLQRALIKPLADKYYSAFDFESESQKYNGLRYGFDNKETFREYYQLVESLLLTKISLRQYAILTAYYEQSIQMADDYINQNLKALGMTRAEFDKLSEKDAAIIEKQFK